MWIRDRDIPQQEPWYRAATRDTQTPALEVETLRRLEEAVGTSTRAITRDIAASHNLVSGAHFTVCIYIIWFGSSQCNLRIIIGVRNSGTWINATWARYFQPSFRSRMKPYFLVKGSLKCTMFMCGDTTTNEVCTHMLSNNVALWMYGWVLLVII